LLRDQEGTGLGLTITKRLIELHDGSLEIESRIGFGTKVVIRLPAKRVGELRTSPRSGARASAAAGTSTSFPR
jgi:K+-sensing histidine kinase KdpD